MTEGRKDDDSKLRWDLLPVDALESLAEVYTIGARKYSDWNWRKGMKWSRLIAALYRHMTAWQRGHRFDLEDHQEHLASVFWCAITLMEYQRLGLGEDDRPCSSDVSPEYVAGLIDGDGCITASWNQKQGSVRPVVQIGMTQREAIDRVAAVYGGVVHESQRPHVTARTIYQWACPATSIDRLLSDIIPHLALKGRQAELALELRSIMAPSGGRGQRLLEGVRKDRERLGAELKQLNHRRPL